MSGKQDFKALLNEKLTEMAQEITELFDKVFVAHEREIQILKEKSTRQQQLLISEKKPRVVLRRSDVQSASRCRLEVDSRLDKRSGPPHIKEEEEELIIKQEQGEVQESMHPPISAISEKEEEKSIVHHLKSPQKLNIDKCRSDKQTRQSTGLKQMYGCLDPEDISEITDDISVIDSDTQSSSDSEDSAQWSPESEPGQTPKRAALKALFEKSLQTKSFRDTGRRKQNISDEGSEIIFECAQCQKTFLRETSSVRFPAESITHCSACSTKLKQRNSVCRVTGHGRKKSFICSICKKGFTSSDNLSSHMLIHKGESPHSCSVCTKSFKDQGHLKAHERIHTGEKPFSCAVCKKTFTHQASCDRHERNHQEKRLFSCSDCGAKFKQKAHYQCHLAVHSGEFKC